MSVISHNFGQRKMKDCFSDASLTFCRGDQMYVARNKDHLDVLTTIPDGLKHARQFTSMLETPRLEQSFADMRSDIKAFPFETLLRLLRREDPVPMKWMMLTRDFMESVYVRVLEYVTPARVEQYDDVEMDVGISAFITSKVSSDGSEIRVVFTTLQPVVKVSTRVCRISDIPSELSRSQFCLWVYTEADRDRVMSAYPDASVGLIVRVDRDFCRYIITEAEDLCGRRIGLLSLFGRDNRTIPLTRSEICGSFNGDRFLAEFQGLSYEGPLTLTHVRELILSQINRGIDIEVMSVGLDGSVEQQPLTWRKSDVPSCLTIIHDECPGRACISVSGLRISGIIQTSLCAYDGWTPPIVDYPSRVIRSKRRSPAVLGLAHPFQPTFCNTIAQVDDKFRYLNVVMQKCIEDDAYLKRMMLGRACWIYPMLLNISHVVHSEQWGRLLWRLDEIGAIGPRVEELKSYFVPVKITLQGVVWANIYEAYVVPVHVHNRWIQRRVSEDVEHSLHSHAGQRSPKLQRHFLTMAKSDYDLGVFSVGQVEVRNVLGNVKNVAQILGSLGQRTCQHGCGDEMLEYDCTTFDRSVPHSFLKRICHPQDYDDEDECTIDDDPRGEDRGQDDYEPPESDYWETHYDEFGQLREDEEEELEEDDDSDDLPPLVDGDSLE